jgi:hypothetical protein
MFFPNGGGLACLDGASPDIVDCHFEGNRSHRGAIYCSGSAPSITGCTFIDNVSDGGGAIWCRDSSPVITGCHFEENVADGDPGGGIALAEGSLATISGCIFVRNSETGVACIAGSSATLQGCTFVAQAWSTIYVTEEYSGFGPSSVAISNSIITAGTGAAVVCGTGGSATLSCCDVFGNQGGDWIGCIAEQYGIDGNICEDPRFCDPASGDYTIHAESPCAPGLSGDCGLIGALPVGCGMTAIEPATWGSIKQAFR